MRRPASLLTLASLTLVTFLGALWAGFWGCASTPSGTEVVSEPIIHIGQNAKNPALMETAILLVIQSPFETVRSHAADPSHIESYMAFAAESRDEPMPGGPESDRLVKIRTTIVEMFGVSVPGKAITLRWHPLQQTDSVFAISFEQLEGAYEHLSGTLYGADVSDGSTAVMLRTTTRSGFLPEGVRERIARWHAEASIQKLTALLESASAG